MTGRPCRVRATWSPGVFLWGTCTRKLRLLPLSRPTCTRNQRNVPRLGAKSCFWSNPRRVLGSESIFGPILGEFWASNRFLAQSSAGFELSDPREVQSLAGFGLQISFWCETRRVSGLNSVFGLGRGSFRDPRVIRQPGRAQPSVRGAPAGSTPAQ